MLAFAELEALLGRKLPASARRHSAWWGNHDGSSQARAWLAAGWRVAALDLVGEQVTFGRMGSTPSASHGAPATDQLQPALRFDSEPTSTEDPAGDLDRFYGFLRRLGGAIGGPRTLAACDGRMGWPTRGVYFFFEPAETRPDGVGSRGWGPTR